MEAGYEISCKYDASKHQIKKFKVSENTACLTECCIYEVKKGVKYSLITQTHHIAPHRDIFHLKDNFVGFLNLYVSFCRLGSF